MALKRMAPEDVKLIVIHCSATKPSQDIGVREINDWHQKQGWLKVGYHYVIRRDGIVEVGRHHEEPGAHASGVNQKSIGVCLVGGLDVAGQPENNFTPEQFAALKQVVIGLRQSFPNVTQVIGHRDVFGVKKACPCFDVKDWLASVGL